MMSTGEAPVGHNSGDNPEKLPSGIPPQAVPRPDADGDKPGQVTKQGNLYIEGSELGRWMSGYIDQQIVVPRNGTMAIDPRITPAWGGPGLGT